MSSLDEDHISTSSNGQNGGPQSKKLKNDTLSNVDSVKGDNTGSQKNKARIATL